MKLVFFLKIMLKYQPKENKMTEINKISDEKRDPITSTDGIQRIIRTYFKNLCSMKLENLKETYIS